MTLERVAGSSLQFMKLHFYSYCSAEKTRIRDCDFVVRVLNFASSPTQFATRSGLHDVVIVGTARTPIGGIGGALASLSGPKLGAIAIQGALKRAGLKPEQVDEVVMGNVVSAGVGQAPARQAALFAGAYCLKRASSSPFRWRV